MLLHWLALPYYLYRPQFAALLRCFIGRLIPLRRGEVVCPSSLGAA